MNLNRRIVQYLREVFLVEKFSHIFEEITQEVVGRGQAGVFRCGRKRRFIKGDGDCAGPRITHALSMHYQRRMNTLSAKDEYSIYTVSAKDEYFIHTLPMHYPCIIYALSMHYLRTTHALATHYPCTSYALSMHHPRTTLSSEKLHD